jgi:hypothetical protein
MTLPHHSADNPYAAPIAAPLAHTGAGAGLKPLFWSVAAVFGSAILGGLLGSVGGAALGAFVPDYYRSVIPGSDRPGFDPLAVGIGLGLTQGIMFGAVVGLALAAMYYWHHSRVAKQQAAP